MCGSFQIDYFERAKRLEEIPLIKKAYDEQRIKDMELWELQEEERVRKHLATQQTKLNPFDVRSPKNAMAITNAEVQACGSLSKL